MNSYNQKPHKKSLTVKMTAFLLLFALVIEMFSVSALAEPIGNWISGIFEATSSKAPSANGVGSFNTDEEIAKLKQDLLASIRDDLLMKIDEYELTGEVGVILTFSDNSIIDSYTSSSSYNKIDFSEYRVSSDALSLSESIGKRQNAILNTLLDEGLVSEVKHTYVNMLDGAYVITTYEQLDKIYEVEGVERITLSNTYNALAAVENKVNVYETGIFNSGNVSYTGKGTVVAILDTGCDYTHTAFTSYTVQSPKYTRSDIEAFIPDLQANSYGDSLEAREVYYGNITGEKIVFGYDYADKDPDIMPFDNSHGTHVAGIIGGKDETITGVAIDTQFAIMKVFSDYKAGATDGDIIAALEDSIILGVDAINMSLGSSCGYTYESSLDEIYKNELYAKIEEAGISLIVAASNDYNSGFGGEGGSTNKTDNPDSATVGSPSTYAPSMSVASINGTKEYYMFANGDHEVFFNESSNMIGEPYDFFEILGIKEGETVTYDYVTVPGVGLAVNYAGIDVTGKIALVQRGEITFEEKVQYAQEAGAIAVVIYNNVFGDITMTIGNHAKIPAVSIGKDDGEVLAALEEGTIVFDRSNVAGPFMSDFSSWGPTPDLKLKPEITAHGGNILSAVIGGYDELSGTSMAAPNMCGITVLIRQYVMDNFPELSVTEVRDLVNRLCMSTATIALDKNGKPYSPRKQGAGIADIVKSTTTDAYLLVEGINKTKLELGDDPERKGVYTMSINLCNLSASKSVSYKLGNITMTESVSTSDPEYVAQLAHILSPESVYTVEGGTYQDGIVTVEAGKSAKITLTITLSAEDKAYINSRFENGMYVEGYLTFDNTDENGVDLNAPFLAFYGNWSEAPIFDLDFYEVETEAHNNAIDDDDKIKADYYATTPLGTYYYDYILPLGSYLYKMDESEYSPIPATREHAAISYFETSISGLFGAYVGLLRGAKEMTVTITNTSTGEIVYQETDYNCIKSHYSGGVYPYVSKLDIDAANFDTGAVFAANNTKFEVTMSAKLDWDTTDGNLSDTYSYSFYIDYEAPMVIDSDFRTEYDKSREENRYYLDVTVYDNHYVMSCRPVTVYDLYMEGPNEVKRTYSLLSDYAIPVYQENRGEATKLTIEITDYLDAIASSADPSGISLYLDDYALNSALYYIPFPSTDCEDLEFSESEITIDIHDTFDLSTLFMYKDTAEQLEIDYLRNLKWSSSDESVVTINGGKIEGLKTGSAVISVTSASWDQKTFVNDELVSTPLYKSIVVKVTENVNNDNPDSSLNVPIEELKFRSYKTLFAFNNDIDYSEIGRTDSVNYFGDNPSIAFYPSEKIQLYPQLKPWNIDESRYTFTWSSSNPNVATVDENGVVTAEAEGKARITLNIKIDGKTSLLAARLSVEVKSEFIINNRTLVAYKGKGGDVVIPDDEGIIYIGEYAFCHFYLDNEKYVEKDENGYYDIDEKKTPYGNETVTSVVIPEGVMDVQKYAFYNCNALSSVTLPESCETISYSAFAECDVLEDINLENVNVVANNAFYNCESLTCDGLGGANLSNIYTIGDYAFAKTALDNIKLTRLSRVGVGIFSECTNLKTVELGKRTRISKKMFEKTSITSIEIYSDTIADEAFIGCSKLTSVTVKNNVTYIGKQAFKDCSLLSSVKFEGEVEQISDYAFGNCKALKELTLPNCKIKIGNAIFSDSGIKTLVFAENTEITDMGITIFEKINGINVDVSASSLYERRNDIIYTKDGKTLVFVLPVIGVSTLTVPAEVETIADGAFSSASTVITINFENGSKLHTIGKCAFSNCTALITVNLPNNTIVIEDYAFYGATSLTNIDLSKVSHVGEAAFTGCSLKSADLTFDNVYIGAHAFVGCSRLATVNLGKNAFIGEYAFSSLNISKVDLMGDATISAYAFARCPSLSSFDFADVVTPIGEAAFFNCTRLTSVNAPKLTGIGTACFGDCYNLSSFIAPELKTIGDRAFALHLEGATVATKLVNLDLPKLETLGESVFLGSRYLKSVNAPSLKTIGQMAFATCDALESITLSPEYTEVADYVFYGCKSLNNFDFSNIVTIGFGSFSGAKRPANLVLNKVESIGEQAFVEAENASMLVSVEAPNLKFIGDMAFAGCTLLNEFHATSLEEIGAYAFAKAALVEFEVSLSLKKLGSYAFGSNANLKAFYVTVNENKVYTTDTDGNVMIRDGVLYLACKNGYALFCYPEAKDATEYSVAEGTTRIELGAFMNNTAISKVTLPSSLRVIANFAFYGCESLKTVEFKSYYAPTLEGTLTIPVFEEELQNETLEINVDNSSAFPGFEKLYKYDYYYMNDGFVYRLLYYRVFVDIVGGEKAQGLTAIIPTNNEGYDSLLYSAYFTVSDQSSGVTAGKYAIAFMDAVNKLPETVDRFDTLLISEAILAFNALEGHADEKTFVDESYFTKFNQLRSDYNVDLVTNLISHIYDIDNSEYSFNKVKEARAEYLALTDADRAKIANAALLDQKIADLATAIGKDIDFSLSYEDHVSHTEEENEPTEPTLPDENNGWILPVIIISASVVVLAAALVAVLFFINKKKKNVTPVSTNEETSESSDESAE